MPWPINLFALALLALRTSGALRGQEESSPSPESAEATPKPPSSHGIQEALLIVESKEGSGSGFVAKIGGKDYLVSNAHVIAGASQLQMKLLSGAVLTPGKGRLAVAHDLAIFETPTAPLSLEASANVATDVAIGDEVVIYGNSLGASVVTELKGKVIGIGPNEIEVDAPFVPGNSGSPIIHVRTGKVIAIASYIRTEKNTELTKDSGINEIRRFGYRLDTVTQWQDLQWAIFQREAALVDEIETFTDDYYAFWQFVEKEDPSAFEISSRNKRISRRIRDFQNSISRSTSEIDFRKALTSFFRSLKSEAQLEFLPGRPAPTYWFTRKKWDDQKSFRDEISEDLTKTIDARQTRSN